MPEQSTKSPKSFLEKVMSNSGLESSKQAQASAKVVFRILRDLMPTAEIERVEKELKTESSSDKSSDKMDVVDLWNDPNAMVAFFSRISPLRQLSIGHDLFLLRLKQEAALPENVSPENVTKAVFSGLKSELSTDKSAEISEFLPEGINQLWAQA